MSLYPKRGDPLSSVGETREILGANYTIGIIFNYFFQKQFTSFHFFPKTICQFPLFSKKNSPNLNGIKLFY
jgi:hypothetical protein